MEACLGIYLGDKIIKYAKLTREEKSQRVSLHSYGTKCVAGNKDIAINEIIQQTGSANDLLCLNLSNYSRMQTEVLKQLGKADVRSVIDLEVADYATGKGVNEKSLEYRYIFVDSAISNDSYTAEIAITDKANLKRYEENKNFAKLGGLYPQEYIVNDLIQPAASQNYVIANIDETTQLIHVVNGKTRQIMDIDVSVKEILDTIAQHEGSYSKACDLCKSINVLSDDTSLSPTIERIIEPTIQDLLNRIRSKLDEAKINCEKIYLNGLINLFINIEVLFEQFFGITTEKARPYFLKFDESTNIAEVIDSADAIALAYQGLEGKNDDVNFVEGKGQNNSLAGLFSNNILSNLSLGKKGGNKSRAFVLPNINQEKIDRSLLFASLTTGVVLAGYVGFSAVYNMEITKLQGDLENDIKALTEETKTIKSDTDYINSNTTKFKNFNSYISDTVQKINEGKIGKYSTYNVANFMQRIAKYIPTNVELVTISSDDNKTVAIVAKSTSYAELGYFISQLKLEGILENISTSNVKNGNYITVTIGGDLP